MNFLVLGTELSKIHRGATDWLPSNVPWEEINRPGAEGAGTETAGIAEAAAVVSLEVDVWRVTPALR